MRKDFLHVNIVVLGLSNCFVSVTGPSSIGADKAERFRYTLNVLLTIKQIWCPNIKMTF